MADSKVIRVKNIKEHSIATKDSSFTRVFIISEEDEEFRGYPKYLKETVSEGDRIRIRYDAIKLNGSVVNNFNKVTVLTSNGKTINVDNPEQNTITVNNATGAKRKMTTKTKKDTSHFTVEGTLYYPFLKTENTTGKFPSNKFQVDISIDDLTKTALEAKGVAVKNKGDLKGDFITPRSKFRPTVTLDGEEVSESVLGNIGNGTTATVTLSLYPDKMKKDVNYVGLQKIDIHELVEYTREEAKPLVGDE